MKTNLFEVADKINEAIAKAESENLIAGGSAYFCGPDGSVDDDEIQALIDSGDPVELLMDIERYRENARPLTEKGRNELAAEAEAENAIVSLAEQLMGAEIEITGSGDGSTGNITIYRIGILNLFSHFTVSAGCSNGNTYEGTEHDGKKFESEPEAISAAQKWIRSLEGEEGPRGESHEVSVIGEYKNGNGEILHTFTTPCIRK